MSARSPSRADVITEMRGWRTRFLGIGAVALLLGIIGAFFNPTQFFRSYIWCYMFFIGVPLGATALLMLQYLTGGAWGVIIRRPCEAASRTLPLLAILFIPVIIGMLLDTGNTHEPYLYQWSHADIVAHDPRAATQAHLSERAFLPDSGGLVLRRLDSDRAAAYIDGRANRIAATRGPPAAWAH